MPNRYQLSDIEWERVADLFIVSSRRSRRPRLDDRVMLDGILWVLCSRAPWRHLPAHFGPWSTVYQRFRDWKSQGTLSQLFKRLDIELDAEGLIDLETWCTEPLIVTPTGPSKQAKDLTDSTTDGLPSVVGCAGEQI